MTTHLPTAGETCATVPLFNVWTIWWNADSASNLFMNYSNAPIFGGCDDAFMFSEVQPITIIVAPVLWLTGSRILAYNVYLILCLTLNGTMTTLLLRDFKLNLSIAVIGGLLMQSLPIVHWQLDVLQMVPVWGLLWVIRCIFRYFHKPSIKGGLLLGLAFSVNYFLNHHYGYFAIVLMPVASVWLITFKQLQQRTFWLGLFACLALTMTLLVPLVLKQAEVSNRFADQRNPLIRLRLSAHLVDYANPYGWQVIELRPFVSPARVSHWFLGLGTFRTAFGLAGIIMGICMIPYRRHSCFILTLVLLGLFFSLGPTARWGNVCPYDFMLEKLPGLSSIRSVYRFGVLTQIGLLLGVTFFISWTIKHFRWTGIFVTLVVFAEVIPYSTRLAAAPVVSSHQPLISWVQENVDEDQVILHWPLPAGPSMYDYEVTTEQMYLSTFYNRRLINGYSAYFPEHYYAVVEAVRANDFKKAINLLRESDVRFIISSISDADLLEREEFRRVYFDRGSQDMVFEIVDKSAHKKGPSRLLLGP